MPKILIAFYSRSGYTRGVASGLARRLRADLEEIEPLAERSGPVGYLRSALEAMGEVTPAIGLPKHDTAQYDLVLIGTPVWFWSLASPVRSYVMEERRRFRSVAFFCTMGGSGAGRVFDTLSALCGKSPRATLALTDDEIDRGADARLEAFARALGASAPARGRSTRKRTSRGGRTASTTSRRGASK